MGWLLALLLAGPDGPGFTLRASPRLGIAQPVGNAWCLPVTLTAEITGPETEELYCPRFEWLWPDGTVSAVESDCPPFEARHSCLEPQTGCGLRGFHRAPDGSIVDDVKECPCTIIGYPRRWTERICLPQREDGEPWVLEARIARQGRTLRRASASVTVR